MSGWESLEGLATLGCFWSPHTAPVQLSDVGDTVYRGYEAHMPHCGAVVLAGSFWGVDGKARVKRH